MIHTFMVSCIIHYVTARGILDFLGVGANEDVFKGTVGVAGIMEAKLRPRGLNHGYRLTVAVDPAKLLYGSAAFGTVEEQDLNLVSAGFKRALRDGLGYEPKRDLRDWSVARIDYAVDIRTEYIQEYIKLFEKADIPNCYNDWAKGRPGSFYWACRSARMNWYNKADQMKNRGKSPDEIALAKNLLRIEIQCYSPKVGYYKKAMGLDDRRLGNFFRRDFAREVLLSYCRRVLKLGRYTKLVEAEKIVSQSGCSKRMLTRLLDTMRVIAQVRSISEARKQLAGEVRLKGGRIVKCDPGTFGRHLRQLAAIGVNPVTIPREWELDWLPNVVGMVEVIIGGKEERQKLGVA